MTSSPLTIDQIQLRAGAPGFHWTPSRKEVVLVQIRAGALTPAEALVRFMVSPDELDGWDKAHRRDGRRGLEVHRGAGRRA